MNNITVIGDISKAGMKQLESGVTQVNFTVADNYTEKNSKTGEYEKKVVWWNLVKWDKTGKVAQKLVKGAKVAVTGSVIDKSYTNKDGVDVRQYGMMITALNILKYVDDGKGQSLDPENVGEDVINNIVDVGNDLPF